MRKILHNEVKEEEKKNTKKCLSRIEMKGKKQFTHREYTKHIHTHINTHVQTF